MKCPRCPSNLEPEIYEGVEIDRCAACKGAWLDSGELTKIVSTVEVPISAEIVERTLTAGFKGIPQPEQQSIERCPRCDAAMEAINYDYASGIVIDRCPRGHGTWLDGGEIERIQAHSEHWDDQTRRNKESWTELARSVSRTRADAADESRRRELRPTRYLINTMIRRLLGS